MRRRAVVVEQLGRPHAAGDQDELVGEIGRRGAVRRRREMLLQAVGQILEIGKPLAQIGIAHLGHPGTGLVLHLLHRRFGGEAAAHRVADALQPAAIGGEHAIGLEYVAMLAAGGDVALRQEVVDRALHRRDRLAQARALGRRILGDDLTDDDARLVQHGDADGEAGIELDAVEPHRQQADAVRAAAARGG